MAKLPLKKKPILTLKSMEYFKGDTKASLGERIKSEIEIGERRRFVSTFIQRMLVFQCSSGGFLTQWLAVEMHRELKKCTIFCAAELFIAYGSISGHMGSVAVDIYARGNTLGVADNTARYQKEYDAKHLIMTGIKFPAFPVRGPGSPG